MNTYIALFRGINVGGKNTLKMKDLVLMLEELGATSIRTYIQSGNVVFEYHGELGSLDQKITQAIQERFGFAPHVLLLTRADLTAAIKNNPFPEAEAYPKALHLGFLAHSPEQPNLERLEKLKSESEQYHLTDRVFYLYAPDGIGQFKIGSQYRKATRCTHDQTKLEHGL